MGKADPRIMHVADEGDEYLVCDWCGHECQDFTSFFGDIRCDECAYEDETYRREILGECI